MPGGEVPTLGSWPTGRKDMASQWERGEVRSEDRQEEGRMGSHGNSLLPEGRTASGQAVLGHTRCGFRCVSGTLLIDRVISWEGWAQHQVPQYCLGACLFSPASRQN